MMPLLLVTATLAVMLALFWSRFKALGWGRTVRLALIWAVILYALLLLVHLLHLDNYLS